MFNAICIGIGNSQLDLKGHILRLSAQFWMGFSVLHLHSYGQQFQTKIKISHLLVKNMFFFFFFFFKQNTKSFGILSLHHFIPAVVIIIEK